jgi:hypothetical protein
MNDGVWKEMRDKEGGQKESDQEEIAKDIRRVQLPAPFYSVRDSRRLLLVYFDSDDGGLAEFIFYPHQFIPATWIGLSHNLQMSLILYGLFLFPTLLN